VTRIPPPSPAALSFLAVLREDGRLQGPKLLDEWLADGRLPRDDLREVLQHVWTSAEGSTREFPIPKWVALFREADYSLRPQQAVRLYRGTRPGRWRRGMSWTTDLDRAPFFADRWFERGYRQTEVVTVLAPPAAMLVEIANESESEVVVDPARLPRVRLIEVRHA
jgi:hypothetical protein